MFLYVKNSYNPEPKYALTPSHEKRGVKNLEYLGAPLFYLPEDLEAFRKRKSRKYWYNINRAESKFKEEQGPLDFLVLDTPQDIKVWLRPVKELFQKRWSQSHSSSEWMTDEGFEKYADALLELSEKGKASLTILKSEEKLLAFSYNLYEGETLYFYQHAIDNDPRYYRYSLGKIFLTKFFKKLIEEQNIHLFDFMIGESSYKLEWAQSVRKVYLQVHKKEYENSFYFYVFFIKQWLRIQIIKSVWLKNFIKNILTFVSQRKTY